jgi:PAS domain S-box-containing protein
MTGKARHKGGGANGAPPRREGGFSLDFQENSLPMWVCETATGRFREVNDAALRHYGYDRASFLELTLAALEVASETAPPAEGAPRRRHRRADGSVIVVRLETLGVVAGEPPAEIVAVIDVTEEVETTRAARRREQRYRHLFEVASDWYWEVDTEQRITYVSPNFEALSGLPVSVLLGKRIEEVGDIKLDPKTAPQAYAAFAERRPFRHLVYRSRPFSDGKSRTVSTSAVPIFDNAGEFRGYSGVCRDITAQVEAEQALRQSEQRFKELYEAASDYFWEMDRELRITYLSPNFTAIFGVPLEDFVGKRLLETPGLSMEPEVVRQFGPLLAAHKPFRDATLKRSYPGGRRFIVKISGVPIFAEDGTFRGYRGVGRDITQQQRADEAATLAQGRLEDAVSHVRQPFVLYDAEDCVLAHNQAFADLHSEAGAGALVYKGIPFRKLAELRLRAGFYAEGPEEERIGLETLLARHAEDGEHVYHLHDDRWMLVDHRRLPGGGSLDLWTDITAIRRARHAEAANRAKSEFLARMSHELRTPLNAVIGYSEMLLEDAEAAGEAPQEIADLRRINSAGRHLLALVNDVLDLSKIEAGKMELAAADFDLDDFIDDVAATCRPLILANGNELALERDAKPGMVRGDVTKLRQIVLNLLSNAAKFTKQGCVTLAVSREDEWVHIAVRDTGIGISRENLPRLFQNFSQIESVDGRYGGTGLGLALSRRLCRLMGGDIAVESEPGHGSCFTVRVPLARVPETPAAEAAPVPAAAG